MKLYQLIIYGCKIITIAIAIALMLIFAFINNAFASTAIYLRPQPGVVLLGYSCGGIHTDTYVTGFDASGNVTGLVYAWTRCGASGRGGGYQVVLHQSWHNIVWDLAGVAISTTDWPDANPPAPDITFTATDAYGDTIFDTPYHTLNAWEPTAYMGTLVKP